jgi:hypothetical protein
MAPQPRWRSQAIMTVSRDSAVRTCGLWRETRRFDLTSGERTTLGSADVIALRVAAAVVAALAGVAGVIVAVYALMAAHDSNPIAQSADDRAKRAEESARIAEEAAKPSEVKFSSPVDLQTQECTHAVGRRGLRVEGAATMRHGETLWLLVRGEGNPVFYVASDKEIQVNSQHLWGEDTGDIGAEGDARAKFTLFAVGSEYNGANQLQRAHQTGDGSISALPPTVKPLATACLVRK